MSVSAWVMLVATSLFLYGGLIVCVGIAVRATKAKAEQGAPTSSRLPS